MTDESPPKPSKRLSATDKIVRIRDVQIGIVERLDCRYSAAMEKASSIHDELVSARAELARLELSLPEEMRTPYMPISPDEVLVPLPIVDDRLSPIVDDPNDGIAPA